MKNTSGEDWEESQASLARSPAMNTDMHTMVSLTLELFSTSSSRQMRLAVRRELNGVSGLIDVSALDGCEVPLL